MSSTEVLKELVEHFGINYSQLAKSVGVPSQSVYEAKNGKFDISKNLAQKIVGRYPEINRVWLLTGEGEMLTRATPTTSSFGDIKDSSIAVGDGANSSITSVAPSGDARRETKGLQEIIRQQREQIERQQNELRAMREQMGAQKTEHQKECDQMHEELRAQQELMRIQQEQMGKLQERLFGLSSRKKK
jgi:plasmid maintenance system antidote protein VapI